MEAQQQRKSYLKKALIESQFSPKVVFISTYIPRKCGIATFTKDLTNNINILSPNHLMEIMALDYPQKEKIEQYPWEVKLRIERNEEKEYVEAAKYLNRSSSDLVCLQHEYGIFGGEQGGYILTLLRNLKKPVITTFHTVVENPSEEQKKILETIGKYSKVCVVMIEEAAYRLRDVYHVPEEKIIVIHHGVPNIVFSPSSQFKKIIGFKARDFLVGSINLISPNKGLEYMIEAIPMIKQIIPHFKFLMIGQTHPLVKLHEDEKYRKKIRRLVKKLKVDNNFIEINRYLTLEELIQYLQALDVYITPYLDLSQTASGTLAYAVGAGKVCVSTSYIYASEMLKNERGLLIPPKDPQALATAIIEVYKDQKLRLKLERNAYSYGRKMIWSRVALDYLNVFKYFLNQKN